MSVCDEGAPDQLVRRLSALGAVVWVDRDELCLSAPEGALDGALLEALRACKPALIDWLYDLGAPTVHAVRLRPTPEQVLLLRAGNGADYVASGLFWLDPAADVEQFQRVLDTVLARHDAFRAAFPRDRDGQFLMTLGGQQPRRSVVDVAGLDKAALLRLGGDLVAEEGRRPFDLARGPMLRVRLLLDGMRVVGLVVAAHHVIMDRWSMDLLGEELALGLIAAEADAPYALEAAPSFAAAVARRGRECSRNDAIVATRAAAALLTRAPEPVAVHGTQRLHLRDHAAARVDRVFSAALRQALRVHGRPPVVLLAALSLLLARRTLSGRLCLGLPVARRSDNRAQATVGLFASSVPLSIDVAPDADAERSLDVATRALEQAIALQNADMVQALEGRIAYGLSPFNVLVSFQSESRAMSTRFKPMSTQRSSAKADLVVFFDDCGVTLEYPEDIGDPAAMDAMGDELLRLAARLLEVEPGVVVDPPPELVTPAAGGSDERRGPAWSLFNGALTSPDAIVLTDWSRDPPAALTYRSLAARAARVAGALRARGACPDARVGIAVSGAANRIVAVLGALWSGAAYVPIDARWPEKRRRAACEGLLLLLTDQRVPPPATVTPVLRLAETVLTWRGEMHEPVVVPEAALSHVLHTSGSTGAPKRVGLERRGIDAFVAWAALAYSTSLRRVLAMTPLSFDLSVFEMFAPLAAGGSLAVLESPLEARRRIAACEPGLINTTPSVMREIVRDGDRLPDGCAVNLAGESFGEELSEAVYRAGAARLTNLYGPTETTTYSSVAVIARGTRGAASIGRPISGTCVHLTEPGRPDLANRWCGELLIGGAGLARGYLADGALTAASFVPGRNGARLYATGDHAKCDSQGVLTFLGRADRQVKRRGVRIELDEVESALLKLPQVVAAATVFQPNEEGGRLVAIVVPWPGERLDTTMLPETLPAYMAPDEVHVVAALPETSSGKLDRAALDLDRFETAPSRLPRNEHEAVIAAIWATIVGREILDREARFFEVGGDSLKLMRVADGLQHRYGTAVSPIDLLRHPTVAGMARFIADRAADGELSA